MKSQALLFLVPLLMLSVAHGQDDTCKCSGVILMSKEELAKEIKKYVEEALSAGSINILRPSFDGFTNLTSTIDKLCDKVENVAVTVAKLEQPGLFPSHPASSCKEILDYDDKTPSGYYWLRASNGVVVKQFCNMSLTCGGVTGGWMKVAELDMTNVTHQCPSPLTASVRESKRVCESTLHGGGCASVRYQTNGIGYSEVCGKVIGYQKGSTDGVWPGVHGGQSINGPYIDGVSLTHGSPRKHIWSFISAIQEHSDSHLAHTCYCTNVNNRGPLPPSFVGQDYFCDTALPHYYGHLDPKQLAYYFMDDPLWDGAGCGPTNECCTFHNPPWFYKELSQDTEEIIEMRVCRDEVPSNEDILLEKVDIYVR